MTYQPYCRRFLVGGIPGVDAPSIASGKVGAIVSDPARSAAPGPVARSHGRRRRVRGAAARSAVALLQYGQIRQQKTRLREVEPGSLAHAQVVRVSSPSEAAWVLIPHWGVGHFVVQRDIALSAFPVWPIKWRGEVEQGCAGGWAE
jgi:hypothetical protein